MSYDGGATTPDLARPEETPERERFRRIDHIAIAVRNLDEAIEFYTGILGFNLLRRRKIEGQRSGMISAELEHHGITFVLCEGIGETSQVSQLINDFGPGVAHIAFEVEDIHAFVDVLAQRGLKFDTSIIGDDKSPLQQVFSRRDQNSGLAFELIRRTAEVGFVESNVSELFQQLEKSGNY